MPCEAPKLDLIDLDKNGINLNNAETIRSNWPSEVALPSKEQLKIGIKNYNCWAELELISSNKGKTETIRRELISDKEIVISPMPDLDPLAIELSMLMPSQVNHIQFTSDSKIGTILLNLSGLELLNHMGIFSKEMQAACTRQITTKETELDRIEQEIKEIENSIKQSIPEDLKEQYNNSGIDEEKKKRLYRQKEWLNEQIYHRLREFGTVLDLSNITDEETVVKLADRINAAYEPIIQSPVDTWPCFKRIKRAKEMYQQEEIDRLIGEIKNGTKSISDRKSVV